MKIKTVVELLGLLADEASRSAQDLRNRARQPHELEGAQKWDDISGIMERARTEIEALRGPDKQ